MYLPPFNTIQDEQEIRELVAAADVAWLVTVDDEGAPQATLLPVMWSDDTVVAHMAKANPHWRSIRDGAPGLFICTGPDAYISPSWYASKAEHGRVVPTWNYSAVHLSGPVRVRTDREWLRDAVTGLTDRHEHGRADRWRVTDAPEQYVDGQLGGIVGVELTVTKVEGKAKLSQNRSEADRRGAIDGLAQEGTARAQAVAADMTRALSLPSGQRCTAGPTTGWARSPDLVGHHGDGDAAAGEPDGHPRVLGREPEDVRGGAVPLHGVAQGVHRADGELESLGWLPG